MANETKTTVQAQSVKAPAKNSAEMTKGFADIKNLCGAIESKVNRLKADCEAGKVEAFKRDDLASDLRSIELVVSRMRLRVRELKLDAEIAEMS